MSSTSSNFGAEPRPLRIAITNGSRSWGGTEHYAVRLAAGLRERGHDVLLLWGEDLVGERAAAAAVPNRRLRLRADGDIGGMLKLAAALRRHRSDAVVLTKWREYLLGGIAARLAGTPLAVVSLGLRVAPRGDIKRRLIFGLADRVIVNAEEIRASLTLSSWIDPTRVRVVHNGVDLARLRPGGDRHAFRHALGVPAAAPLVLAVGNLTPQKDHDLLVRAAARVVAARPGAWFVVAGEGFLRTSLEERVRELGLAERFLLPGFVRDVPAALAAADLFVLSSSNEGMPWALLEALACGAPVVATDVPGTRACVEEGVNGFIVPAGDEAALATVVIRLLDDPGSRARMGAHSRALAEARFAEAGMIDGTLAALREALEHPRRGMRAPARSARAETRPAGSSSGRPDGA